MRQYRLHVLLGLVVLLFTSTALAEVCKGSKIPRAELQEYAAQAVLLLADQEAALRTHLPRGQPACPKLHPTTASVVCYDPVAKVAV